MGFDTDMAEHLQTHADKTLDILRDTDIVNFSAGASRMMILRAKPNAVPEARKKVEVGAFVCTAGSNSKQARFILNIINIMDSCF